MRFDGTSTNYWVPESSDELVSAGAANLYIVGQNQLLRIVVSTATVYAKFGDATMAIAAATNIELPVGIHYVNSAEHKFLSISTPANANVIKLKANRHS